MNPHAHHSAADHDLCSDHGGEHPTVLDLPHVPLGLKREWLDLETRRHFLGKGVKALGWAGLATLLAKATPDLAAKAALQGVRTHFAPKAKRAS